MPFSPHLTHSVRLSTVGACLLFTVIAAGLTIVGCGRSSPETSLVNSVEGLSAEQYLKNVFARYQSAESYRDDGEARLSYIQQGRSITQAAPLQVWFDRNDLYLSAYDVRLGSNRKQFTAWVEDPTTDNFDSQVVRLNPLPERPAMNELLADVVLSDRLSAGLAGPPPQLEWLFAADPMRRLFEGDYQIKFGPSDEIHKRVCLAVDVEASGDQYRFWIDKTQGVIRRVELPSVLLPAELLSRELTSMHLTLELRDATFESPDQAAVLSDLPSRPRYVQRFVPLPPREPGNHLGQYPADFNIRDQTGKVPLSQRGSDREATVLLIESGSLLNFSAALMAQWSGLMSPELRSRVRVIIVTDEQGFRQLPRDFALPVFIDIDSQIANSLAANAGELVVLDGQGRIAWTQAGVTTDSLPQLGLILADVLGGVNVAQQTRQQWTQDRAAYERALNAAGGGEGTGQR